MPFTIVSATTVPESAVLLLYVSYFNVYSVKPPFGAPAYIDSKPPNSMSNEMVAPAWQGRSIAGPKVRLVEFSAFLEQQRDPDSVRRQRVSLLLLNRNVARDIHLYYLLHDVSVHGIYLHPKWDQGAE